MAPLPLAKLAYLVAKQASKPVARALARLAGPGMCAPIGRAVHALSGRLKLRELGLQGAQVPPLDPARAAQQGAELLGELILLGLILATYLVYHFHYRYHEDEAAEAEEVAARLESLQARVEEQAQQLSWLERRTGGEKGH
jgi:hypothetical protein